MFVRFVSKNVPGFISSMVIGQIKNCILIFFAVNFMNKSSIKDRFS